MTVRTIAACAAVSAAALHASASGLVLQEFALGDHPDGNASPPPYGLRMDGLFGGGVTTFSFGHHDDTRLFVVDLGGGTLGIEISGTVYGGEVDGSGGYLSAASYALNFSYTVNVNTTASGYTVTGTNNVGNFGSLVELDGLGNPIGSPESVFTITDDDDNAFLFQADGHRLPGDDSTWVGRGWVTPNDDGSYAPGTQDFLFTAELIPAPGTLVLGMFGLGLAARRRR